MGLDLMSLETELMDDRPGAEYWQWREFEAGECYVLCYNASAVILTWTIYRMSQQDRELLPSGWEVV
jgi:hypothetical protein